MGEPSINQPFEQNRNDLEKILNRLASNKKRSDDTHREAQAAQDKHTRQVAERNQQTQEYLKEKTARKNFHY